MSTNYNPDLRLHFHYSRTTKKLCVKASIQVNIKLNEYLQKQNDPSLLQGQSASIIQYHTKSDGAPQNNYSELVPIEENVIVDADNTLAEGELRDKITDDLAAKNIHRYAITVSINRTDETDEGETTHTISGDGTIEIDD